MIDEEFMRVLSRLDARLEHLERDLCEIKQDSKFKQLIIVLLLSSMLGLNLVKSIAVQSIEGLIDESSTPIVSPHESPR